MSLFKTITNDFKKLDAKSKDFIRPQYVKEIFGISTGASKFWLESANRFYLLKKQYIIVCPICHNIVEKYDYKFQVPEKLECISGHECGWFDTSKNLEEVYYNRG